MWTGWVGRLVVVVVLQQSLALDADRLWIILAYVVCIIVQEGNEQLDGEPVTTVEKSKQM